MQSVYIASPYTKGDVEENVAWSISAAQSLVKSGFLPYCPLLCHFWDLQYHNSYDFWIDYNLEWLDRCDVLVRLPGESKGADLEFVYAEQVGIPVYKYQEDYGDVGEWLRRFFA